MKNYLVVIFLMIVISTSVYSQNIGINTTGAAPASTNLLEVLSTSTTASSVGVYSAHSGAITGTGYGIWVQKTGGSTTNVGAYITATGAASNYAIIVPSGGGNVGIGTTTPASLLHVAGVAQLGTSSATTGQLTFYNSGSNRYIAFQAGVNTNNVTYTLPTADGSSGQALTTNGSGTLTWSTPSAPTVSTTSTIVYEDFLNTNFAAASTYNGNHGWQARMLPSGGFLPMTMNSSDANRPGVFRFRTSGTSGHTLDIGDFISGTSSFTFECDIQETNTSGAAASVTEYNRRIGIFVTGSYTEPANGIYFRTSANGAWTAVTRNSSTETATASGTTPSAGTWRRLKIVSVGTTVTFYVDGSLVATHTTNIPAAGTYMSPGFTIQGVGASSAGEMRLDWVNFSLTVTR